jgi:hypothetical protein
MWRALRDYEKFEGILKEKTSMNTKIIQIVTLLVTVIGTFGISTYATSWVGHNAVAFAALMAAAQILHALFPSIFAAPNGSSSNPASKILPVVILLAAMLALAMPARAQTATPVSTPSASTSSATGFVASSDAVAVHYAGAWSAGTLITESYDFLDFGASKGNHVYLEGQELIAPTPGFQIYGGGIGFQPDLTRLLNKTNVQPSAFQAIFQLAVGNGVSSSGGSHMAYLIGGGVKYILTPSLTWQTLEAHYGRFGAEPFEDISTGLALAFGGTK